MRLANERGDLEQVSRLLQEAAGRMAEAYALLRQYGPACESLRWDDGFAWQLEGLKKAVDTCAALERRLASSSASD